MLALSGVPIADIDVDSRDANPPQCGQGGISARKASRLVIAPESNEKASSFLLLQLDIDDEGAALPRKLHCANAAVRVEKLQLVER
ncbi:hypothetical protein ACOTBZ_28680 [Achromobacter xylosoxidans]|uniref:hypothetical protein n=1 Tax=Achromobacter ruhlandii TaxID=72557 RepID=UPI0015842550|nr:hypothetical protein [Achromobacter ruhlandii]